MPGFAARNPRIKPLTAIPTCSEASGFTDATANRAQTAAITRPNDIPMNDPG
jgi:hypothetical protein